MEATTVRKRGKLEELEELEGKQSQMHRRTCRIPALLRQSRVHHGLFDSRGGRKCICPNRTSVGFSDYLAVSEHSCCRQA